MAFGDADDDGDVDVLIVDVDEAPRLLENRTPRRGHWVSIRLRGAQSNRDGLGARITVKAGIRRWVREMKRTQGLYASHDPRLYFGLGDVATVDEVVVRWPAGGTSSHAGLAVDRAHVLEEPLGSAR